MGSLKHCVLLNEPGVVGNAPCVNLFGHWIFGSDLIFLEMEDRSALGCLFTVGSYCSSWSENYA